MALTAARFLPMTIAPIPTAIRMMIPAPPFLSLLPLPEYTVVDEVGPDHDKMFVVEVKVGSQAARGEG